MIAVEKYKENQILSVLPELSDGVIAKCLNGTFVGKESDGVVCFKGIPFALPPVGNLRWKEPQHVLPSDEISSVATVALIAKEEAEEENSFADETQDETLEKIIARLSVEKGVISAGWYEL